jgi:hypothetical protein
VWFAAKRIVIHPVQSGNTVVWQEFARTANNKKQN